MYADCHIHMVLDGIDWRSAIARHKRAPNMEFIRQTLETYRRRGCTYLRDGGDRWGVGAAARAIAPEYGIVYRTPLSPLCQKGHYGAWIGTTWETLEDFQGLVERQKKEGADFIKIMISGLMDFDQFGVLTEPGCDRIREQVQLVHDAGLSVMAHANGADTVRAAALAGVDSIEHGAYLNAAALEAMAEANTVWVPTLSTVGNLIGTPRQGQSVKILDSALENIATFAAMGGLIAPGSDAGAWAVPHGAETEIPLLEKALGKDTERILSRGIAAIRARF